MSAAKPGSSWAEALGPIDRKFTNVIPGEPALETDESEALHAKWPGIWNAVVTAQREADALQAEVDRLRKVLADAVALIDRSRLFKGYAGPEGPLSTHWADMVSQMAHAALKGAHHE